VTARRPGALATATAAAVALATALSVQAIYRAPLNVDEELTRRIASGPFGSIFTIVANQRGGGPLHFWLIHVTLQWPGGLIGLRAPSLVFFLLALPAVALAARELAGAAAAAVTVLLTACAPLAVSYDTFGRPHSLLLAWISWGTYAAFRAARSGDRRTWIVAGAVLGTAIYAHPTAPIYELSAFVAALALVRGTWRDVIRAAWPGAVALAVTTVPYEAFTAHKLADRYGVSSTAAHGRTFDGKPVWENALRFMSPNAHGHLFVNWLTALAVAGIAVLALQRRRRVLVAVAVIVVLPVLFFTYVPANGLSALFFDRYVLPPLPFFLLLAAVGAVGIAGAARRAGPVVLVVLAGIALLTQLSLVRSRNHKLAELRIGHITSVVRAQSHDAVLFGTAGTQDPTGFLGAFNFGRGANLLDRYLALRIPSLPLVNDDTCVPVTAYLEGPPTPRHGLFLFYANAPDQQAAAMRAFAKIEGVRVQVPAPRYLLIRTPALAPRALVVLGLRIRKAWVAAEPTNPRAGDLVASDTQALTAPASCMPRGPFGDPDISPNFPEIVT
jgi:hypothetical protein